MSDPAVDPAPTRAIQEAFPPDVVTVEQKRRWELCAMSAWMVYGYSEESVPNDRWDLELLHRTTRTYYDSDLDTGEGTISPEMRSMLRAANAL